MSEIEVEVEEDVCEEMPAKGSDDRIVLDIMSILSRL